MGKDVYTKNLSESNPPRPLQRETWEVDKEHEIIFPSDLAKNSDKHGGMGLHMAAAIRDNVITIPLRSGCDCVCIQVTNESAAKRICRDGKVDLLSNGYWTAITSTTPVYHGTDVEIPVWGKTVKDTVLI